jgi:GTP:adenosylcobinamide-phosphate guanylyltransferase
MIGREKKLDSKLKPIVVYMSKEMIQNLKDESLSKGISVSHIVRNGVDAVMSGNHPYNKGYADGVDQCSVLVDGYVKDVETKIEEVNEKILNLVDEKRN